MKYLVVALLIIGGLIAANLEIKALIVKEHDDMPKLSKDIRQKVLPTEAKFTKEELEFEKKNAKVLKEIGED